jgi:hypothetical protein
MFGIYYRVERNHSLPGGVQLRTSNEFLWSYELNLPPRFIITYWVTWQIGGYLIQKCLGHRKRGSGFQGILESFNVLTHRRSLHHPLQILTSPVSIYQTTTVPVFET